MKEFELYEEMMCAYYKSATNYILPINSWEFFGEFNEELHLFKEDISTFQKLSENWNFKTNIYNKFLQKKQVIVITNPALEIVYASHNMQKMNGFTPKEVIGKSPKMFQGKDTCPETLKIVRKAISNKQSFKVSILNYKKDNSSYYCKIKGFPVTDKNGKLVNYIAFEEAA